MKRICCYLSEGFRVSQRRVDLLVCQLTDFHHPQMEDVSQPSKDPVRFGCGSG